MTEAQVKEFDEKAKVTEEQTDQFELVGEDVGEQRVLSTMNIVPVNETGRKLEREEVMQIAMRHFEQHFNEIGWHPSGEYPDVIVKQKEDGTWLGVAFLKNSGSGSKDWGDFPRVGVDTRTAADV